MNCSGGRDAIGIGGGNVRPFRGLNEIGHQTLERRFDDRVGFRTTLRTQRLKP
jgi:hypothetical protein